MLLTDVYYVTDPSYITLAFSKRGFGGVHIRARGTMFPCTFLYIFPCTFPCTFLTNSLLYQRGHTLLGPESLGVTRYISLGNP